MSEQQPPADPRSEAPWSHAHQQGRVPMSPYPAQVGDPRRRLPPPSKSTATWALVLAVAPLGLTWIAAAILAIIVLSRSKDGRDHGKGMAIAALIVVSLWVLMFIGLIAANLEDNAERDGDGKVTMAGDVSVTDLRPGDCIPEELGEETYLTVPVVPCAEPHRMEVYGSFTLPRGDFPGQDEVDRLTDGGCLKRFESYIGAAPETSDLEILYLRPLKGSWRVDRGVTCLASTGATTTGSLKGSGPGNDSGRPERPGTDV